MNLPALLARYHSASASQEPRWKLAGSSHYAHLSLYISPGEWEPTYTAFLSETCLITSPLVPLSRRDCQMCKILIGSKIAAQSGSSERLESSSWLRDSGGLHLGKPHPHQTTSTSPVDCQHHGISLRQISRCEHFLLRTMNRSLTNCKERARFGSCERIRGWKYWDACVALATRTSYRKTSSSPIVLT